MTTDAPDIFGDVESALPEGWHISALIRQQDPDTGDIYWGASAELWEDEDTAVEEDATGDTPAEALRNLVQRLCRT